MSDPKPIPMPLAKRWFDIIFSLVILVVLSPILLIVILVMLLEFAFFAQSRGPILYSETRISQGRPFTLYKFRVFKKSALEGSLKNNGFIQTKDLEQNPKNLTLTGRLLKQAYLDEIPQLINVLKADMSLVGPRPTNVKNFELNRERGGLAKSLLAAGITGYFQSHKGLKLHKDQEELDMEYARFMQTNPGWKVVLFDLKILLISIYTVLRAEGI
ncbi:MAG: sugar transferase [bacterium]|nr:sugar transferase [bacterium]